MNSARAKILWFGSRPDVSFENACADRDLTVVSAPGELTNPEWAFARGAVISTSGFSDAALVSLRDDFGRSIRMALCHGLKVIVVADLERIPVLTLDMRSSRNIDVVPAGRANLIAEKIARHDPGPAWSGAMKIEGANDFGTEDEILIRRAFGDCRKVTLVPQSGGRSARVFCAYAQLVHSRAGPLPLPFFVKLDRRDKIERELTNYHQCTTLFVPFNQRPNVDSPRCAIGEERGIIVGNFVEESESLRELVERGTARNAVNSVFGGALRGWRAQAHHDAANTVRQTIAKSLSGFLPSAYFSNPARRRTLLHNAKQARSDGVRLGPRKIEKILRELPAMEHRCSLMHGDLHGDNVRVHGDNAILIDFASIGHGPLVADPAALDVALVLGAHISVETDWESLTNEIYRLENLLGVPPLASATERNAHLWNSVRQIRQIALGDQISSGEYAAAVSIHLLRRASYRPDDGEPPLRRVVAYKLAESIALGLRDRANQARDAIG